MTWFTTFLLLSGKTLYSCFKSFTNWEYLRMSEVQSTTRNSLKMEVGYSGMKTEYFIVFSVTWVARLFIVCWLKKIHYCWISQPNINLISDLSQLHLPRRVNQVLSRKRKQRIQRGPDLRFPHGLCWWIQTGRRTLCLLPWRRSN